MSGDWISGVTGDWEPGEPSDWAMDESRDRVPEDWIPGGMGTKGKSKLIVSADPDTGVVGTMNTKTGRFTPIITGLQGPHGLALL